METVNLFGTRRGRLTQAAVWSMERERFSAQALAGALEVSIPTAISLLRRLEEAGLASACGAFHSTGGRRPRAWSARPSARFAVGVDVTRRQVTLVAADLAGHVLRTRTHALPFSRAAAYWQTLASQIASLCEGLPGGAPLGVGLSIPGIVSRDGDVVLRSHALSLREMRVEEMVPYLGEACRMINDANAGCLAEARADVSLQNAVYLSLSDSVGGAILVDRRLRSGQNQRIGEVGHATLFPGGRPCYCGQTGCVDAYCRAGLLHAHTRGNLPDFFRRLRGGDAALRAVWEEYLSHVAIAANSLRMILDCDVILGGYVGREIDDSLPELRARAAVRNPFEQDGAYIKACVYKQEAAALGAALLWIEAYLLSL